MKGMIFAAGLGTRLRPLTNDRPKALIEVGGMTMLERTIRTLQSLECDPIVVNVHHFADKIVDYLREHDNCGSNIIISDESDLLLDTGGGVLAARQWLDGDEPILVHNADIITRGLNYNAMISAHTYHAGVTATLLMKDRVTQRKLLFDHRNVLRGWTRLDTGELRPASMTRETAARMKAYAFSGVHVLSPRIFKGLQLYAEAHGPVFSIMNYYIDECNNADFYGYVPTGDFVWHDVGKPESLQAAQEEFRL